MTNHGKEEKMMKSSQNRKQKRTLWAGYSYQNAPVPTRGPAYVNERPHKRMHFDFGKIAFFLSAVLIGVFVGSTIFKMIPRASAITFGEKWDYSEATYVKEHTVENPYRSVEEVTDAYELWRIAYSHMLNADYVTCNTTGYTKASIATQQIKNYKRYSKKENYLTFDIESTGLITVSEKGYYDLAKNRMTIDIRGIGFSQPVEIGYYLPTYGRSPRGFLNFEVTPQTILSKSGITKVGDEYEFTLHLDPIPSAEKYTRQVYHLAGGQGLMPENKKPIHKEVVLLVRVDANFKLQSITNKEKYKIFTPLKADCVAECVDNFSYEPFEFSAEDKQPFASV